MLVLLFLLQLVVLSVESVRRLCIKLQRVVQNFTLTGALWVFIHREKDAVSHLIEKLPINLLEHELELRRGFGHFLCLFRIRLMIIIRLADAAVRSFGHVESTRRCVQISFQSRTI